MHVTQAGGQRARVTVAFAAALALVVPGASVSPRVVTAAEACIDGWSQVALPAELAAMEPQGAASLNGQPAWIVGIASARQKSRAPLLARWRNGEWQKTTGPWKGYGVLNAVAATSSNNAWAVGSLGSYTRWPISARWDGTAWKAVSVPRPKGQLASLVDIAMISPPQRFWAVGARLNLGQVKPVAMKRRPGGWRFLNPSVPSGTEAALTDVTVAPGGRAWAAGWRTDSTGQGRPWVIHRQDGKWRNSPLAAVAAGRASIMDLAFSGSSSGWAVGFVERSGGGGYAPILQRWNGSAWNAQDLPWAAGRSILLHAVEATAEGDLIVAGMDVDNIRQDVLARLDAAGWKVTSLSAGTRFNSVMMDTAPTSSGGFAAGFFDRQPVTMFACAGGTVKTSLTGGVTTTSDGAPALVDEPTHDEAMGDDMHVAADSTSGQSMTIANTIAVDMTAAAGLQLSAPTWEGLVADFTGDGRDDLFIGLHYQQLPKLMVNSQSGVFSEQPANFVWQDRHGCDAADIDQDGSLDLYCTIGVNKGTSNTPQELLLNVADGGVLAARQFGVLDGFGRGRNVTFLNLGGDPYPDLYVMNEPSRSDAMSSSNRLYRNVDGTAFMMAPEWGVDLSMGGSCGLGADLDGDGDDDLIVCTTKRLNDQPAGARLFVNEGDRFVDRTAVAGLVPAGDSDVAVADFDGDGLLDIAQLSSTRLLVSLAAGDGTFAKSFELQTTGAVAMAVGDVDGDARPDIYVARRTGGNSGHLMLVNRNAATDFVAMTIPQPGSGRADDVMAIDYDLNGRTDFITLNGWNVSGPVKLTAFFAGP